MESFSEGFLIYSFRDVLLIWIIVRQGHIALVVGADGSCLDIVPSLSLSFLCAGPRSAIGRAPDS